ncbi:MAG TPA: glycoside hydrolase family 55 protein [Planctomycetota bacterium]|nr:glycoside hydrolase family 55 protein [Planctomycetota bacterium]HRR80279.1 glycoside hydrolase family 55 protein [Planctomycetota bacterium]
MTVALLALAALVASASDERAFPDNAGMVNVSTQYGARGDGKTDDWAAIQKAIDENKRKWRLLYFPNGTYLVTKKLTFGRELELAKQLVLQGESREGTIIRLADNAPDFEDPGNKNYLLTMFEGRATGMAFHNSIHDMTFDVGKGNPGAVGVQWMNNNTGCMRNVTIRSSDPEGKGAVGLDLTRTEPGPGLIKNVLIEGFDYGIDALPGPFSMTFEHITLRGQRVAGIRNKWHTLTIRRLESLNKVPAILATDRGGMIALLESSLAGGDGDAAVVNQGILLLRDVKQSGYAKLVKNDGIPDLEGESVEEYVSHPPKAAHCAFPSPRRTLRLPLEETPDVPWDPPDRWVVVDPAALKAKDDDTATLQTAFDAAAREGKSTVCIPGGIKEGLIRFGDTIRVHGSVRRILGMDTTLCVTPAFRTSGKPMFRIEDVTCDVVAIERFTVVEWGKGNNFAWVEHATPKTLVVRDIGSMSPDAVPYVAAPNAGKLFVENSCSAGWRIRKGQKAWMRQINPETNQVGMVNEGGDLWILGLKTENGGATVIKTSDGGRTELLGGQNYSSWPPIKSKQPMFLVENSSACFSIGGLSFVKDRGFDIVIRETRSGETRNLSVRDADAGGRGHAGAFPLVTAFEGK